MLHGHLYDYITNIKGKILNVGFDLHGKLLFLDEVIDLTKNLPVLPYRDEENIAQKAIKDEKGIDARREMIKNYSSKNQ